MANFDSNKWYQIRKRSTDILALAGTSLFKEGKGAVFFQLTNTSVPDQQWQVYTVEKNEYVLRPRVGGPTAYMTTTVGNSSDPNNSGNSIPRLTNYTLSDDSMYWS